MNNEKKKRMNRMNARAIVTGTCLLASIAMVKATVINIPDGAFQNVNAAVNGPISGTVDGNIGVWSAQVSDVLGLGGQMASSNAATANWPTPPGGDTYELRIALPAGAGVTAWISQALTNNWQRNSVYTLSVDVDEQSVLDLISGVSLNLYNVGTATNLASTQGSSLVGLFNNSSNFQPVNLVYKTPNTVPTNTIGVYFSANGVAGISGSILVDSFQLSVAPIQVQLAASLVPGQHGSQPSIILTGQGGAPGATYEIISSTNLLVSMPAWSQVTSNQFDTNGNFSYSITVDPSTPYRFFRTVVP
jgi:hypothetical protein